ncbi:MULTISPECIES: hypothetical protein [unclassified Streptomyces]|uniref:hypothetical protein n=1 Tax=unclassified Streptomyces TaxID=2593676 RepID=UPI000360D82D|nr:MULTISPECIES: hypothetical protein [unclassified Streptomyces]MYW57062.1 hypothetical protein [Streptomyces sp. SID8370]MYW88436.1 hypothetical protein [Streptomyces sp. SID8371]
MSTSWRQRALERNREANRQFFAELEEDHQNPDSREEELRRFWLEAARHYDSTATLDEELTVRLKGDTADRGALDFRIGDALLKPLRDGVSAAARKDVELELTGLSQGSTVLHVRPKTAESMELQGQEDLASVDSSVADPAIRDLLKLVDAAENERDVRQWERMIPGLDGVVEALDKFDLSMEMRWRSLDGAVRSSSLSGRGKGYVRNLRNVALYKSQSVITGRITELREAGLVKVKTGLSRRSTAYEVRVERDNLIDMHLELGMMVSFVVQVIKKKDKIGRERSTEYRFVRMGDGQGNIFDE